MIDKNGNTLATGECYVCGRWGTTLQPSGKGFARHVDCGPGSEAWADKFPNTFMGQWYIRNHRKVLVDCQPVKGGETC